MMPPAADASAGAGAAVVGASEIVGDPARVVAVAAVVAGAERRPPADPSARRFNCAVSSSPRGCSRTPAQSVPTTNWRVSPLRMVAFDPWICSNAGILSR